MIFVPRSQLCSAFQEVCVCVCARVSDLCFEHRKLLNLLSSDRRRLGLILAPSLFTFIIPRGSFLKGSQTLFRLLMITLIPPLSTHHPPQHLLKGGIFCYYFIIDEGETNIKWGTGGGRADDFPCGRSGFTSKHNNGAHLLWRPLSHLLEVVVSNRFIRRRKSLSCQ